MLAQITLVVVLLSPIIASAVTIEDCPYIHSRTKGKFIKLFQDKCYYFNLRHRKNFKGAQAVCRKLGGNLAMVQSAPVNGFLHSELAYTYGVEAESNVWIGLSDLGQEGVYRWVDGSAMNYRNFASGEGPRAGVIHYLRSRLQDCVAMSPVTGKWHDYKCEALSIFGDETRPFICELKPKYRSTTATSTTRTTTSTVPTPRPKLTTSVIASANVPVTVGVPSTPSQKLTTKTNSKFTGTTSTVATSTSRTTIKAGDDSSSNSSTSSSSINVTSPITTTTAQTNPATTASGTSRCPDISCKLDCGLKGFVIDNVSGCFKCKCGD